MIFSLVKETTWLVLHAYIPFHMHVKRIAEVEMHRLTLMPFIGYFVALSVLFRVDRLQIIVVAKKYIYVSQLFISRTPKMRAIPQLVSAPLNPIPIAEHFRGSHPPCEHSRGQHIYVSKHMHVSKHSILNNIQKKRTGLQLLRKFRLF